VKTKLKEEEGVFEIGEKLRTCEARLHQSGD